MKLVKRITINTIILFFAFTMNGQSINANLSKVNFTATNMKWMSVDGTFTGMNGELSFDESDYERASFNVCVDAASVNTENGQRDTHLKNEDFFHVTKYPSICFTSSSISKTNKGFTTTGTLDMVGTSKDVTINFTHTDGKFVGNLKINRLEHNVGATTGTFMVGDEIDLEIIAVTQ